MLDLPKEYSTRLERLQKLAQRGFPAYPARVKRTHTIAECLLQFEQLLEKQRAVNLVGRIRSLRPHGGSAFAHIDDGTDKIQLYIKKEGLGDRAYKELLEVLDIGDFVEASGKPYVTKRGEKSILVEKIRIITKTLLPLPEKWHGLSDTEARYRKRYLDLIANREVPEIFEARAAIIKALREFFDGQHYLEVETPILHQIAGGAAAQPFVTHHNALHADFYLRIAPELYLKRLLVGGLPKVYEIGRCFRNEGIDVQHNPEFTILEAYEAYANYENYIQLIEQLLPYLAKKLGVNSNAFDYGKYKINFKPPYPRLEFRKALIEYGKFDIEKYKDDSALEKAAHAAGADFPEKSSRGKIFDELYKTFVRPKLIQPTFIIDHPVELSPLSKRKAENPRYVERFQLVLGGGIELVNAFSELNDPLDQKTRFEEQEKAHKAGETDTHRMDEDFIETLMHGMPPAAGLGIGVDRLVALLTNQHSIKEVILFPTLRPVKRLSS